jgi:hypothetical protein
VLVADLKQAVVSVKGINVINVIQFDLRVRAGIPGVLLGATFVRT